MVAMAVSVAISNLLLSVLALSSRFDGRDAGTSRMDKEIFQYSLCRVVLMVDSWHPQAAQSNGLSVLALSSRFDGPAGI